jgi:single-stranded-DNA-specific exonuclease
MDRTNKKWEISPRISLKADQALSGYPPILRQILFNRGYATHEQARRYLQAKTDFDTDPFQLKGMEAAVERIDHALEKNEKIAIYGDYDVDGVSATALLLNFFKNSFGADIFAYIPNRFEEGYGLNEEALTDLKDHGVDLVITVDCGIRALGQAEAAHDLGLDLIVSDHHHPGPELPAAVAVIDPKQPGDSYPEKNLAGVGVAYKLASAVAEHFDKADEIESYLDLVALGTVADIVPLIGENRALVRAGLEKMRQPNRQGLLSLIGVAGLKPEAITATDIGFGLGPRLNAAGRLDSALGALELLTTQDVFKAGKLAQELENQNRKRQSITRAIQAQAEEKIQADDPDSLLLFAADPDFNAGVVGLAASRLTDQYYRPAIVGHRGEDFTQASCRSIKEFNITEALDQCADLLESHGGHAAAAGFTVRNENIPALVERLKTIAEEELGDKDLRPTLAADMEISLSELKAEVLEYLDWLQPTGYGNRQATFVSRNLEVKRSRAVGKEGTHLKLALTDGRLTFDAIAFRQGDWQGQLPSRVDVLYHFELNEYRGRKSLQLNVKDIKASKGI